MNKLARKYMEALQRRSDHLARRVAEADAAGSVRSYDRAELAALNWAIQSLESRLPLSDMPGAYPPYRPPP